jgi:DNA-directed RNA polymerase subunit RPC12/RpoP
MLTRIACPHCGYVGAAAGSLPRVLICSQCEHGALIKSGTPARSPSVMRDERAAERAAWERYAPPASAG